MMKVVAFIMHYRVAERIIEDLKLWFVAEMPSPSQIVLQAALEADEMIGKYF
ncbi:MAG: acid--CoA ligase [Candidatus Aminicenantes bacterium]|jgi:hypothetical protein|nr:acid--CoA ligase [Candidatus Aminicenantes bacterium]